MKTSKTSFLRFDTFRSFLKKKPECNASALYFEAKNLIVCIIFNNLEFLHIVLFWNNDIYAQQRSIVTPLLCLRVDAYELL